MWRRRLHVLARQGVGRRLRASQGVESPALGPGAAGWREDRSALDRTRRPRQGVLGDCWVVAALLAVHEADPAAGRHLLAPGPGDTWAVTLYVRRRPVRVLVDRTMPVTAQGRWAYAREAGAAPGWVGIVEKAAALHMAGSYRVLARGFGRSGLAVLTGLPVRTHVGLPPASAIDGWLRAGHAIVASTHPASPLVRTEHGPLPRDHVMAVVGADPVTGHVRLRNPWRPDDVLTVDARTFRRGFLSLDRTVATVRR